MQMISPSKESSCEMTRMLGRESCSGTCPGVPGLGYATAVQLQYNDLTQ